MVVCGGSVAELIRGRGEGEEWWRDEIFTLTRETVSGDEGEEAGATERALTSR